MMTGADEDTRACGEECVSVRDLDRIREKISIRLETRQIVLLGIGLTIILAATFLMGALTGGPSEDVAGKETRAIAGAPVYGALSAEPPAFSPRSAPAQNIIVGPTRRIRKAVIFPVPVRKPLVMAIRIDSNPAGGDPRRGVVDVPCHVVEWDGPWPSTAVTDPGIGASCIFEDRVGCGPEPVLGPMPESKKRPEIKKILKAKAKASKPSRPAKKILVKRSPGTRASEAYSVQVRSYKNETKAREFASDLASRGYSPFVARFSDGQGNLWYRVRLGRFNKAGTAMEFASVFNEKEDAEAIPVTVEPK